MSINGCMIRKLTAGCLATILTAPLAEAAPAPFQQTVQSQSSQNTPQVEPKTQGLNPGPAGQEPSTTSTENPQPAAPNPVADPPRTTNQNVQAVPSQPVAKQQQNSVTQPVGTAAAPHEKSTGVAASRPAGAVIAPAKQRRARSFIIKFGVVIGACAAVGTVALLSHSSSSQPH